MKQLELKTNRKTGARVLYVYYSGNRFDEAITTAKRKLGLKGARITVIALPIKMQSNAATKTNYNRLLRR